MPISSEPSSACYTIFTFYFLNPALSYSIKLNLVVIHSYFLEHLSIINFLLQILYMYVVVFVNFVSPLDGCYLLE